MSRDSRFQGGDGLTPHHLASQAQHASVGPMPMGDVRGNLLDHPEYAKYNQIPADYVIQILLGGAAGSRVPGQSEPLRPEPWLLYAITYATTADVLTQDQVDVAGNLFGPSFSEQARSVELEWGDEFTKFMGNQPALVASIFADSYGFLDLSEPLLFQGSQQLSITLHRLFWPFAIGDVTVPEVNSYWDFTCHGVSLLPKNVNESGAV